MNREIMPEIQHLERQVDSVEKKVSSVERKVDSILVILQGNEMDREDKGMIGQTNDHEKRIQALEKMKDRIFWFLIGLSAFASWGLMDIIEKIVFKK